MKVALITGGNRGIGLGITRRLVTDGFAVSILARSDQPKAVLAELRDLAGDSKRVHYVQGSVADLDVHARFINEAMVAWGRLDLLVNNAGIGPSVREDILHSSVDEFDSVIGTNLRGPYFLTQTFANQVIKNHEYTKSSPGTDPVATIINVSSISASTVSIHRGEYCVSKAGVGMATRLWAVRLASEGILVYEVRPGIIATDMTAGVVEKYDGFFAGGNVPIARWGQPDDVAGAVSILASGATPYSTGEVFHVDGGLHIPVL